MVIAQDISLDQAKSLGEAAIRLYSDTGSSKKSLGVKSHYTKRLHKEVSYYILNMEPSGYVVMSADDDYHPVLAFSEEGQIDFDHPEANIGFWGELSRHEQNIEYLRQEDLSLTSKVTSEWSKLRAIAAGAAPKKRRTFQAVVEPLTTTRWNQSGFYNESCPPDSLGPNGNTYCGCVPIAVSQLMRYYENTAPGNGAVSYVDPLYGPQSVDLCGQQFDWASMPDTLAESNLVLADFIYDVGKSMETNYSTSYTGTYSYKVRDALVYNYGFDHRMKSYYGTNSERYSQTLREEFENGRVVFLSAWSVDSLYFAEIGHTWVADGYGYSDTGAEYMHFNWGWGGSNNGWFLDTEGFWVPHADNKEQAKVSYYWYRYTLYNIFPASEDCQSPDPNVTLVDPEESYAWMYYRSPVDEEVRFRYREKSSDEWIENEVTYDFYSLAKNLKKGTTYEYQLARNCCGEWSSFSDVAEFQTLGPEPEPDSEMANDCAAEDGGSLYTSSISDDFAYIYTSRPHGQVNNQFRYKLTAATDWIEGEINATHFYTLSDLAAGSTYEFQVRHECAEGVWSEYSSSQELTTNGQPLEDGGDTEEQGGTDDEVNEGNNDDSENVSDCPQIPTSSFTAGYEQMNAVTAYFVKSSVGSLYRWRYRAADTDDDWSVTEASSFTSANLTGLSSDTEYEYQVSQMCDDGWSIYSESNYVRSTAFSSESAEVRSPFLALDENSQLLSLTMYPNPTASLLMIELTHHEAENTIQKIEIVDISGQIIRSIVIDHQSRVQLDLSQLAAGIYHSRVILLNDVPVIGRFIKM